MIALVTRGSNKPVFKGFGILMTFFHRSETFSRSSSDSAPEGARRSRARRGADLRVDISIDFMDAAFGKETEIEVSRHEPCDECHGTGTKGGAQPSVCPYVRRPWASDAVAGFLFHQHHLSDLPGQRNRDKGPMSEMPWSGAGPDKEEAFPEDSGGC